MVADIAIVTFYYDFGSLLVPNDILIMSKYLDTYQYSCIKNYKDTAAGSVLKSNFRFTIPFFILYSSLSGFHRKVMEILFTGLFYFI